MQVEAENDGVARRPLATGARRARTLAASAAVICVLSLVGWLGRLPLLIRLVPDLPSIKVNTALAFLLLAISVWRTASGPSRVPLLGAPLAMGIAALSLWQWPFDADLGIDNLLLNDWDTPSGGRPGRMAGATSISVLLIGISLLSVRHGPAGWRRWRQLPTLLALGIAYLASVGLLLGAHWSGWLDMLLGSVSLHTATLVLLLGTALLGLDERSPVALVGKTVWASTAIGLVRLALPLALLAPAAASWLLNGVAAAGYLQPKEEQVIGSTALGIMFGLLAIGAGLWVAQLESVLRGNEASLTNRVAERTAQLAAAERRSEQSRLRLAHVVKDAVVGIVSVDSAHRIVLFNGAAERMFDRAAEQVMDHRLDTLLLPPAPDAPEGWLEALADAQPSPRRGGARPAQLQGVRADGSVFPVEVTVSRSGSAEDALLTVVLRDMTEALALEAERRARERAETADRAKSEQLGQISHELRTPLNAVIGFSELMLEDPHDAPAPRHRQWLAMIRSSGQHMLKLIDDLVELGRVGAGMAALELAPVDVTRALQSVLDVLAPAAREAGVQMVPPPHPDLPVFVRADERRLHQVLLNLVGNAIKYNHPGGFVRLRARSVTDAIVVIDVEDTGIGLSAEQIAHLFEPFNRLGRERSGVEGTGLGLVLARALVLAMGGQIEVRSDAGRGSEFRVSLPRAQPPQA